MTLKELKAKLDAAAEALKANPEDATLKGNLQAAQKAYDDAKAEADADENDDKGEDDGELDVSKLDPKAQKLIADLRKENADRRTQNKGLKDASSKVKKALIEAGIIESDDEDPEEKLKVTSENLNSATVENAILKAAIANGVGKDQLEFYSFLVQKKLNGLKDDEEMNEEAFAEIAKEMKKQIGSSGNGGNTSVGAGNAGGTKPPNGSGNGETTLEAFVAMNMGERAGLYQKNPEAYNKLMREAVAKRLI